LSRLSCYRPMEDVLQQGRPCSYVFSVQFTLVNKISFVPKQNNDRNPLPLSVLIFPIILKCPGNTACIQHVK
jgi:hypothetical protein